MRSFLALALIAAGLLSCEAPPAANREISPEEVAKLLEQKDKVFFLDVRNPEEIEKLGSIQGYVNIPLKQLEQRLAEVPKDKLIITA